MLFRHPNILKYVSSWQKGGAQYLVTECIKPLHSILKHQNTIQVCLGLKSVLKALVFLVEQANLRHLNICMASVYVTLDGQWKLGGFEFVFRPDEVTADMLGVSKSYRYQKAVNEKQESSTNGQNLEQFAFSVFCSEIFKLCSKGPFTEDFQEFCATQLEKASPSSRPTFSAILEHQYFNQEFVKIHEFLSQIPLKSALEKHEFFSELINKLKTFNEVDVAVLLGDYLLSRIVLLDETAQTCVTPFVLDPKCGKYILS